MWGTKTKQYKSTCSYCGVGCGVIATKDQFGKLAIEGDQEHPVNRGMLCSKGLTLHHTAMDNTDRLLYPQMRWSRGHELQRVSWDSALERTAAVFKSLIEKHGPDSVGLYVSGQCLTEEYYLASKLTKGFIGTNNIDTNSRLCMSSAVTGYKLALGEDSVPISYADIELADCFFITGANPAWCHPILFRRIEQHKENNPDVKLIVVDPRKTNTCAQADLHLQINPGTDIYLYHALGRILIEEGLVDQHFVDNNTEGYEEYKQVVFERTVEEAALLCGIDADDISLAASYIGNSIGFISMWAMGLNQSVIGVNKNLALINLSLITGQIGKPGSGPFSLTGQPNAMGGREVGGMCNLLPAHRSLDNPVHRKEVAQYWGVPSVPAEVGLSATEMIDALNDGRMKAIWIICTNPMVSLPDINRVEAALKKAKFVVVQDISNLSDTVSFADVVLPAAAYMEKEGTMTNSERRISYLSKVIDPPGEALPDSEILIRFAQKMGFGKAFNYDNLSQVYREYALLTRGTNADISGLTYDILKEKRTVQWPFPQGAKSGTQRLFTDKKFFTPSEKAQIHATPAHNESEIVNSDYPLILTTGRVRDQWHTMTRTGKVNKLLQHIKNPYLEIHPEDAKERGITEESVVNVYNDRGTTRLVAKVTEDVKRGVVFVPMHWGKIFGSGDGRVNNLTKVLIDPRSKQPDLKFSAVNVKKHIKQKEKIVVVGAGAAAFQFVKSYREANNEDEIVVFSREPYAFYNRVLLPDYISGTKDWKKLQKTDQDDQHAFDCEVHTGVSITEINRQLKTVTDAKGNIHSYDKLILATGSSPFIPNGTPKDQKGIFSLRSRMDADKIREYTADRRKVVIVGAGLLGIELAASLTALDKQVTVIQRSSRIMERQLDEQSSALLDFELKDRNIQIIYNEEVKSFIGDGHIRGIRLKSGRELPCSTLVFAIGTRPNTELAKKAGIHCNRGVVVNDYLQTNDPSIYAIGEIAEHNKSLYGITAAAEEQAHLVVKHLNGDPSTLYQGSLSMNILKVDGLELCSVGMIETPKNDESYEEIVFLDIKSRYYKKCIVYKDRLVGCILMGNRNEFLEYRELIKNRVELGDKRRKLLQGSGQISKPIKGKLVCSCNGVGEGNLIDEIKKGCTELSNLCNATGAGTGCGSCKPEVAELIKKSVGLV